MREYLSQHIIAALGELGVTDVTPTFEKPRQPDHGDLTTNVAMVASKKAGGPPRKIAEQLVAKLKIDASLIGGIEIAGPGFINFRFTEKFFRERLAEILQLGGDYGKQDKGNQKKTQVEFVSANPTGPLTVGHGRGAVYGDTVARLLEWMNYDVTREYYFNNAGRQMRILGDSVRLRYLEILGSEAEFPEDYYQGGYIKDIAQHLVDENGDKLRDEPAEGVFKARAEQEIFDDIKKTLERIGVRHDVFYNENTLYDSGKIKEVVDEFRAKGLAYDQDGAVWFKASVFGGEKDKVIVKSTGEPTYRLPDIAYHREKIRRGFQLIIDVLGADHVATYPDVVAGLQALGMDTSGLKFLIHQFVTILQDDVVIKMSTRKANFITLDELMDEAGVDVTRYFFLMRGIGSHLNFDMKLAKEQSDANPVYYLQYAHARISSIVRMAEGQGIAPAANHGETVLAPLHSVDEIALINVLAEFPIIVESCALTFEPHRLAEYLHIVAGAFHKFYHECRVIDPEQPALTAARLALCLGTKTVLANGFNILGITAPEKM
jgi:arginyl-tRNA synthetase